VVWGIGRKRRYRRSRRRGRRIGEARGFRVGVSSVRWLRVLEVKGEKLLESVWKQQKQKSFIMYKMYILPFFLMITCTMQLIVKNITLYRQKF